MKTTFLFSLIVALQFAGCRGQNADQEIPREFDEEGVPVRIRDTVSLVMPELPADAGAGFVFTSTGRQPEYRMTNDRPAQAFLCLEPMLLQIWSRGDYYGIIALIRLNEEQPIGTYQVEPGTIGIPESSTARMAFQDYEDRGNERIFRGLAGDIQIEAWGDTVVGSFSGMFQEGSYRDSVLGSGRFRTEVVPGTKETCQVTTRQRPPSQGFGI